MRTILLATGIMLAGLAMGLGATNHTDLVGVSMLLIMWGLLLDRSA